ncbi:ribosomal protein L29 [Desulfarculus baarsii DSM 2075]|uniref:Large ribosomal subunit protein uL29 n=1 Tax=Desulfarculus baarsii (strain ATCC 33931 / DSM 2075 / LMG 7858 / VKM B-1802 / 2st14) TaxID=644282 RepID=E1QKS4_DESB2|nr:50S ribosomal protein L29 [Desulfarculus baarsii]ADK86283.1 ribosomal protein L29 [Desulfarculus baarsii DSM 2075]
MKASELKSLSLGELERKLDDLRQELFNLKFQNATGQLENPMKLGVTKKDIARVLTVMRQLAAE